MSYEKLHIAASNADSAQDGLAILQRRYGSVDLDDADVVVCLGGDGYMLHVLHETMGRDIPIYGMNRGTIGFLMNEFVAEDLPQRLADAETATLYPLTMVAETVRDETIEAVAINEVSLLRETRQAAKLQISVDGHVRLPDLICDGAMISTPAGSTAYNLSAHGPILPIDSNLLALTPISAFRPRRWPGALLPHTAVVTFEINEADKRPVSAVADHTEVREVVRVTVSEKREVSLRMLFDKGRHLSERIIDEQFLP